jgi:N6-adenosine-specific RNA methylase IME4
MEHLECHEFSNLIPAMTPEQYGQLVEDMGAFGLREPITLYQDRILDGRHRYRAIGELAERGIIIEPRYQEFDGSSSEAYGYVLSMNLHRRHLEYSQRAALAAQWKRGLQESGEVQHGGDRTKQGGDFATLLGKARDIAAEKFQVGSKAVDEAEQVMERAPELFEIMMDGGIGLREAQKTIREREHRERNDHFQTTPFPTGKYQVLYADPPWRYDYSLSDSRKIENQYPTMELDAICALDVPALCAEDCVIFLWATSPKLAESMKVIEAWGFSYRTCAVWDKEKIGMGYYFRQQHELLLVATKGEMSPPEPSDRPSSVIHAPRTEHSVKPACFRELIQTMYPGRRYLEMFARTTADGWDTWGNECEAV